MREVSFSIGLPDAADPKELVGKPMRYGAEDRGTIVEHLGKVDEVGRGRYVGRLFAHTNIHKYVVEMDEETYSELFDYMVYHNEHLEEDWYKSL